MSRAEALFVDTCLSLAVWRRGPNDPEAKRLIAQLREVIPDIRLPEGSARGDMLRAARELVLHPISPAAGHEWDTRLLLLQLAASRYLSDQAHAAYCLWRADPVEG